MRVNTLVKTVKEMIEEMEKEGWKNGGEWSKQEFTEKTFFVDSDVQGLLVFAPKTNFMGNPHLKRGELIIQDKASCLPSIVLNPPEGSFALDACASPGNKTTHLAALMGGRGKVLAIEKDRQRFETLKKMCAAARAIKVETLNADFLRLDPSKQPFFSVEYILLDPSCSGSGIVSRMDHLLQSALEGTEVEDDGSGKEEKSRLEMLASFQLKLLLHAMSFPNVQKITYSTCSVHEEENEKVVKQALESARGKFELVEAMPSWTTRGHESVFKGARKCVRATPEKDATIGFFVACFQKATENSAAKSEEKIGEGESKKVEKRKIGELENTDAGAKKKRKKKKKKKNK